MPAVGAALAAGTAHAGADDLLRDWLDMVERTQAAQPHWMTPLLSPAHQLDAVEHLNREATATATATDAEPAKMAQSRGPQVLTLQTETSGGALDRTGDLGIMIPLD